MRVAIQHLKENEGEVDDVGVRRRSLISANRAPGLSRYTQGLLKDHGNSTLRLNTQDPHHCPVMINLLTKLIKILFLRTATLIFVSVGSYPKDHHL